MKSPSTQASLSNYLNISNIADYWQTKTSNKQYKYARIGQDQRSNHNFTASTALAPELSARPEPTLRYTIGSPQRIEECQSKRNLQSFLRGSAYYPKGTSGQSLLSNKANDKCQILQGNSEIKINNLNRLETVGMKETNKNFENGETNYNKIMQKLDKKQKLINELKKLSQFKPCQKTRTTYDNQKLGKKEERTTTKAQKTNHTNNSFSGYTSTVGSNNSSNVKIDLSRSSAYQTNTYDKVSSMSNIEKKALDFLNKKKNPQQPILRQSFKKNKSNYYTPKVNKGNYDLIPQCKWTPKLNIPKTTNNIDSYSNIQLYNTASNYKSLLKDTYTNAMNIKNNEKVEGKSIKDVRKTYEAKLYKNNTAYLVCKQPSIHDFQLKKTLGEGKFGTVFQALHKETRFLCALKKISKNMIKQNFMIDQFLLQVKIQSYCNHQNILKLYGFFDDNDHIYLILQYMQEGTLFSQLKKNKTLTESEAGKKLFHVAEAITYMHQEGIAHRDIKPQNIVMSYGIGKLCDFGWAAICTERRKTYCGTFDYAAPQILQGSQYDMSVDLWCLGVLAYQLMVGKVPFYHISRKQTMKKILNVESTAIQFPVTLSKNAINFIESLIRKKPEQRLNGGDILKHLFLACFKDNEL